MATHFDLYGQPNGWSSRPAYVALMAVIGVLLPLAMVALVEWLGATRPEALNVPGRDYWFHPVRRAEGVRRLRDQTWRLACLILGMIIALHGLILFAHTAVPPHLPTIPILALIVGFLLAMAAWAVGLYAGMRVPPGQGPGS